MSNFKITKAWCRHQNVPLVSDELPRFCWQMSSDIRADTQTAYRIQVATDARLLSGAADVWDSGLRDSGENLHIPYEGEMLLPLSRYYWQVTAINSAGEQAQSDVCWFETGKLDSVWKGNWIGAPFAQREPASFAAPYFRKLITPKAPLKRAVLVICGLGNHEVYMENEKIGDGLLEPAYTRYDISAFYTAYDLLPHLPKGGGMLGVLLGNGMYNAFAEDPWASRQATWRSAPKLLAEIHLTYEDDSCEQILSDLTWQCAPSPITFNGIRNGEAYDANLEQPDWCCAKAHDPQDERWQPSMIVRGVGGRLTASPIAPIRISAELPVVRRWRLGNGDWVFDLGQNFAGFIRLRAEGPKGQELVIRYGERLTQGESEESVDQSAIGGFIRSGGFQTDRYIKKSDDVEVWSPRLVYHGFQYVQIQGLPKEIQEDCVAGIVIHTDMARRGFFQCSDPWINRIQQMCHWSSISNFHGTPTDCPHREKNPWTGDGGLVSEQFLLNYDSAAAYEKWVQDMVDAQRPNGMIPCIAPSTGWGYHWGNGPDWSLALSAVPWHLYLYEGDLRILERFYPAIARHFAFMESMSNDWIVSYGIGDWCAPFEGEALAVNMATFKAPVALTDTISFYQSACILAKMEKALGLPPLHELKGEAIRKAIRERFLHSDGTVEGDCQTSYGSFLYHGLADAHEEEGILERLLDSVRKTDYHPDYGLIGSKYILQGLCEAGHAQAVYEMATCEGYPGYRHFMDMGLTTLGECWNGKGSRNHYMFSDISAVFYRYFAGIRPLEDCPGFRRFLIAPVLPDQMDWVDCRHESLHGSIGVRWERKGEAVELLVSIPFGTQAELRLPEGFACASLTDHVLHGGEYQFMLSKC